MPLFEIEQYELHTQKFHVEAATRAEAIQRLFGGEATPVDNGLEFIEVADDYGLPTDENRDMVRELKHLGVSFRGSDDVIPSIRSIEEVP